MGLFGGRKPNKLEKKKSTPSAVRRAEQRGTAVNCVNNCGQKVTRQGMTCNDCKKKAAERRASRLKS